MGGGGNHHDRDGSTRPVGRPGVRSSPPTAAELRVTAIAIMSEKINSGKSHANSKKSKQHETDQSFPSKQSQ